MPLERNEAIKAQFNPFYYSNDEWTPKIYKDLEDARILVYISAAMSVLTGVIAAISEKNPGRYAAIFMSACSGAFSLRCGKGLWNLIPQIQAECNPPLRHRVKQVRFSTAVIEIPSTQS